jgi:hypothetical protein
LLLPATQSSGSQNLDGNKARKLIKGPDPCISPDGSKVAFTMSPEYLLVDAPKNEKTSSIYQASINGGIPGK